MSSRVMFRLATLLLAASISEQALGNSVIGWGQSSSGRIAIPADLTNATAIAAGTYHGIALRNDGTVALWGGREPELTNVVTGPVDVTAVAAGFAYNLVLLKDGSLVSWGENNYGQTNIPPAATNVAQIGAGSGHNLLLRRDGTVLAWGRSDDGQANVPMNLSNVTMVAAGGYHNLAMHSDGNLVAWGLNDDGQSSVPSVLSNVVAVAAGGWHNLALKSDGTVMAWGYGGNGQTTVPTGLSNVVSVACAQRHSFAIRADGSAVAWGFDNNGQATIPASVSNSLAFAGGVSHSLALMATDLHAPIILRQPLRTRIFRGTKLLLSVGVVTTNPPSYQWRREGNPILGATNASYEITAITPGQAGDYSVIVSNSVAAILSSNANVSVVDSPPYVFSQPTNVTTFLNGSARFEVVAHGSMPLMYQWKFNGNPIAGATNTVYQKFNATNSHVGNYTVTISNALGVTTSAVARLAVPHVALWDTIWGTGQETVPPDLTNALVVCHGHGGSSFSDQVNIALRDDGSIISWGRYTNVFQGRSHLAGMDMFGYHALALGSNGNVVTWANSIDPATNTPASASNIVQVAAGYDHSLALRNDGKVIAWGNNADGQTNVPSDLGPVVSIAAGFYTSVAVRADGTVRVWGYYPGSSLTNVPASVSNVVEVSTTGEYGLGLRQNGTVVGWGAGSAPSARNPPAGLSDVVSLGAGYFHGAALKRSGEIVTWGSFPVPLPPGSALPPPAGLPPVATMSASVYHTVAVLNRKAPVITQQPIDAVNTSGGTALFRATAVGGPPMFLRWQRAGTNLPGATWPTLAITNLTPAHVGAYRLIASNSFGSVTSRVATLAVTPLQILSHPTNRMVYGGDSTTFSSSAQGANLTYQWQFNGLPLNGATNSSLTLSLITTNQAGNYSVLVTNSFGTMESSNAALAVVPIVITRPPNAFTNHSGKGNVVSVSALKNGPFAYQWLWNGNELAGQTNNSLHLDDLVSTQSGLYGARVSNPYGSVTSNFFTLTVVDQPPFITTQPLSKRIWLLADADFWTVGDGSLPLGYRWRFGNNYLTNQFENPLSSSLDLDIVPLARAGDYFCDVTNSFGLTSSVAARLTVVPVCIWPKGSLASVPVSDHYDWTNVAAGEIHFIALRTNRTLVAYGNNTYGQQNIPSGATNIIAIASGANHSLALRADGIVLSWGNNTYGQRTIPVGLSNVTAIACGYEFSCALRSNGTVAAWGRNTAGEVTQAAGLSNVIAIACGDYHGIALLQGGGVKAWGLNTSGQTNVPVTLSNATGIAAGVWHSIVLLPDGTTVAWGSGPGTNVNAGATNIIKLTAGSSRNVAIQSGGNLINWGGGASYIPPLTNVIAVTHGYGGLGLAIVSINPLAPQPPRIVTHPVSQAVIHTQPVTLQVAAIGAPPLAFQWSRNGDPISGRTNATLLLTNLSRASSGYYSVLVTNAFGAVTSGEANVRVVVPQRLSPDSSPADTVVATSRDVGGGLMSTNDAPFFTVWASSNLVQWTSLPDALSISNGVFLIRDSEASMHPKRFYRLSESLLWRIRVPQRITTPEYGANANVRFGFGDFNGVKLTMTDAVKFEIHASTNLVNWSKLATSLTLSNGMLWLEDTNASLFPRRFYRVIEQP